MPKDLLELLKLKSTNVWLLYQKMRILNGTVNEYNDTYHRIIKIKPVDVKDNTYINSSKEVTDKDPKFQVGDHVSISKYKNIFAKGYTPNWSEKVFVIEEVKNTVPWTYVINDLNGG